MTCKDFTYFLSGKRSLSAAPFRASGIVVALLISVIGTYWGYDEYTRYHDNLEHIKAQYLEKSRKRLQDEISNIKALIKYREQQVGEEIERELQNYVHSAYTVAAHLYSLYEDKFDEEVLKKTIIETLRPIRWNMGKGYYYVGDMNKDSFVLDAASPEKEGLHVGQNSPGYHDFEAFKEIAYSREAGFYRYLMTKPESNNTLYPKLGFIKHFKPYNWFLGTGVYLDEMTARTQRAVIERMEEIRFADNGYFICLNRAGQTIADFDPLRRGRSMDSLLESNGCSYGQQLFKIATSDIKSGFYTYELPDNQNGSVLRLAYVCYYEPWQWIVIASVELTEMQQAIGLEAHRYKDSIAKKATLYLLLVIFTIGIIFLIALLHANKIKDGVSLFSDFFRDSAEKKIYLPQKTIIYEEFELLSHYANRMVEELKAKEKIIQSNERRLDTLLDLAKMSGENITRLACFALKSLCEITSSELAYICLYNEKSDKIDFLVTSESLHGAELPESIDISADSLPAKCFRAGREVVDNSSKPDMSTGVYPAEVSLKRCLDVPFLDDNKIILIAGVCNKDDNYTEQDVSQIYLLLEGVWHILLKAQADREMNDLRKMLKTVYDSMPSALIVVDNEYNIILSNNVARKLMEQSIGHRDSSSLFTNFPRFEAFRNMIDEVINSGNYLEKRNVPYDLDGQTLYETITVYPLESSGMCGAVIRLDDVTNRLRVENLLVQSEKMLSVGGLAAGMAHEINKPLAGITQNIQMVKDRFSREFTKNHRLAEDCNITIENMRKYLEQREINTLFREIEDYSARAVTLVMDMLAFTRKGNVRYSFEDICQITESALGLILGDYTVNKNLDVSKIRIVKDYAADLPLIPCDKNNIQQAVFGLLANSIDALDSRICENRSPQISIRIFKADKWMVIHIEDNGRGMDEESIKRVFEPFYTTKSKDFTAGLGLSISYFIVNEQHSGNLSVESSLGEGTRFSIRLPLERQDE